MGTGIEQVIAHRSQIDVAAVTARLIDESHVRLRIDVRTSAKADGVGSEIAEFINDPTASGFDGYLRRYLKLPIEFSIYKIGKVQTRITPSGLIDTVQKKTSQNVKELLNTDSLARTYFSATGSFESVVISSGTNDTSPI